MFTWTGIHNRFPYPYHGGYSLLAYLQMVVWKYVTNSLPKLFLFKRKIEPPESCNSLGVRLCTIGTQSLFFANTILRQKEENVNSVPWQLNLIPTTEIFYNLEKPYFM